MPNRIKVDLETAKKFEAQGFVVECFIVADSKPETSRITPSKKRRRYFNRNRTVHDSELIRLCKRQNAPLNGKIAEAWQLAKPELFPTNDSVITMGELRALMTELGSDRTAGYYLMHNRPCIELVEPQPQLFK